MHTLPGDHLDPARIYIQRAYMPIATFANGDEIWQRRN
jgi:hypothetical protein